MNQLLVVWALVERECIRFFRQKSRLVGALGTPILFWLLIGSGIGKAFQSDAMPVVHGYLEYFFPGTLLLILVFSAIFSNISVIEDHQKGFMQSVLVAPVGRSAIVLGKSLGAAVFATAQAGLFLALAGWSGFSLSGLSVVWILSSACLVSFSLGCFGFVFAWRLDSIQGFHAVMNLVIFPMWLLSGALFPLESAPLWLRTLMWANPLTYGLSLVREGFYPGEWVGMPLALCLGMTSAFALCFLLMAILVARNPPGGAL